MRLLRHSTLLQDCLNWLQVLHLWMPSLLPGKGDNSYWPNSLLKGLLSSSKGLIQMLIQALLEDRVYQAALLKIQATLGPRKQRRARNGHPSPIGSQTRSLILILLQIKSRSGSPCLRSMMDLQRAGLKVTFFSEVDINRREGRLWIKFPAKRLSKTRSREEVDTIRILSLTKEP